MIVVLGTRDYFAVIFSESPAMQRAVGRLAGLLGITMLLNSTQQVISGMNMMIQIQQTTVLCCVVLE